MVERAPGIPSRILLIPLLVAALVGGGSALCQALAFCPPAEAPPPAMATCHGDADGEDEPADPRLLEARASHDDCCAESTERLEAKIERRPSDAPWVSAAVVGASRDSGEPTARDLSAVGAWRSETTRPAYALHVSLLL